MDLGKLLITGNHMGTVYAPIIDYFFYTTCIIKLIYCYITKQWFST